MADSKVSGLAAVAAFADTQEIPVNDSGTSKKLTGAQLRAALPQGTLTSGYAQVVAGQTGITSTGADLTGLTVTVTPSAANRRLKITGQARLTKQGTADFFTFQIQEGATVLSGCVRGQTIGNSDTATVSAIIQPTQAAHTYKLTMSVGSGTVDMVASTNFPAWILVEDIGT